MTWETIAGKTKYIDLGNSYILVYELSDTEVVLIDTGLKEWPELLDELRQGGRTVKAVLCTHPHVDHIGNNRLLVQEYGMPIYVSEIDAAQVNQRKYPYFKWDEPYELTEIPTGTTSLIIGDAEFGVLDTPGHTSGHLAYVTPDKVCFLGDAMMTERLLRLAKLPYMDYVDPAIKSMLKIMQTEYPYYVMAHKGVVAYEAMPKLVELNVQKEIDLYHHIEGMITGPVALEELVTEFMKSLNVSEEYLTSDVVRWTARIRIRELANAGAVRIEGDIVY